MTTENVETVAAPTAATDAPQPGTAAFREKYAKQASLAVLKESQAAAAGLEAAQEAGDGTETPADDGKPRERGADGKFKPKGAKSAPKTASAKPAAAATDEGGEGAATDDTAPADVDATPAVAGAAGLGRARKLIREGNIAAALDLIGLSPDKLEGKQWGAFRQREKAAQEAERKAVEKEAGLSSVARQLQQQYGRYDEAQKAYEAEDYETAFKLAFNESPNDFQRKQIHALHSKTKDPEVVALRKKIQQMEEKAQTDQQQQQAARAEHERKQARQTYQATLATELSEMDDPRFARVAAKPAFIKRVFDIQEQHWNERAQTTIDTVEAAELAWEELYEGVAGETGATTAQSVSKATGTPKTPVRQGGKTSTTLNPHEASEASPAHKLKPGSPELRQFYARKAELAALGDLLEQDAG